MLEGEGGMPGHPSSCWPAQPRLCSLPAPSSPPSSSDGLGDAFKPLPHLSAWIRSQFLHRRRSWAPNQARHPLGTHPESQRGQQDTATPMPTRTGTLGLVVTHSTQPPSLCAAAPQRKGTELLEAAFPVGPPSQSPVSLVHLGNRTD